MATQLVSPTTELFHTPICGGRLRDVYVSPAREFQNIVPSECEIIVTNEAEISALQL